MGCVRADSMTNQMGFFFTNNVSRNSGSRGDVLYYDDQAPVPKRNSQQHFGRAAATLCFWRVLEGRWILH